MPRLVPSRSRADAARERPAGTRPEHRAPASRTQAILEYSLRQLAGTADSRAAGTDEPSPPTVADAQGLVTRLRRWPTTRSCRPAAVPTDGRDAADPLAVHFRETAALTEAAVRYAADVPRVGRRADAAVRGAGRDDRRGPAAVRSWPGRWNGGGRTRRGSIALARFLLSLAIGRRAGRPGAGRRPGRYACSRRSRAGRCGS